jgi:hypothetical protein
VSKSSVKTDGIALLLKRGYGDTMMIAAAVSCSPQWVNHVWRRLNAYENGGTIPHQIARLSQDVRDLRKYVLHQQRILDRLTGKLPVTAVSPVPSSVDQIERLS